MTEKELLSAGYRKYTGNQLDIYFNKDKCEHAGKCVEGVPEVFDTDRKPWVLPADEHTDKTAAVIKTCPSGALKYRLANTDDIQP